MKTKMINTRILLSGATILAAAAVIVGATFAFFSDTETSTGNTLAAGAIDLQIDNTSYVTDAQGNLVESESTTWELADLDDGHLFFNFLDIKPGDIGEDTISIHVDNNDAWVCAAARVTEDSDVSYTEPELDDDPTINEDDPENTDGELAENLNFAFWADDGDNVLEDDEESSIFIEGPASNLDGVGGVATLADSENNIWTGASDNPLTGDSVAYVGKAWCFGTLTPDPVAQDDVNTGNPIDRGTGFTCNGDPEENNAAQTDRVVGDFQFYAVQSRNNTDFTCAEDFTPDWEEGEEQENIGAALGAFIPLDLENQEVCDVTVGPSGRNFTSIQAAIDDAGTESGDTVCVAEGTYDEDVTIDKEITLSGDGASATSTINGQTAAVGGTVLITADNVTVEGFEINGAGGTANDAAVYLSGARTGVTIQHNALNAGSGGLALLAEGGQSNHVIQNNVLEGNDSPQIVYVNGTASVNIASTNVDFLDNTFQGTVVSGGLPFGQEASSSDVMRNVFDVTSTFSVVETWATGIALNMNNFNGEGGTKVTHSENGATGETGTLDAENNWWGDADASDNVAGEPIDFDPEAPVPFPEN